MRYLLLFFILSILTYQGNCQDSLKNNIKVAMFSSLDPINPSVDLAYERFVKDKRSIQIGLGYILPTGYRSNKGFKLRTEYRFYKKESNGLYFAPELLYMYNNYATSGEFGKQNDSTGYNYTDNFKVDKHVFAITGKVGYQHIYKHFCIDLYTGIGVRFRFVNQYSRKNPVDDFVSPIDMNANYMADMVNPVTINLSLNMRVGFCF